MDAFAKKQLDLLEFREELIYWRKRQILDPKLRFPYARLDWVQLHRDEFRLKLNGGWVPDLVTGFWDVLPFSKHDLRLAALLHDIDYTIGGVIEDRWSADRKLLLRILDLAPGSRYLVYVASPLVFLAVRFNGWRGHFVYRPQRAKEILRDITPPWEWKMINDAHGWSL